MLIAHFFFFNGEEGCFEDVPPLLAPIWAQMVPTLFYQDLVDRERLTTFSNLLVVLI